MPERTEKKKEYRTILTVREVAEYLRMSETKVYRLAKERQLPVVRIGKAWRFRKDLLDDWLSKCTESNMETQEVKSLPMKNSAIEPRRED